MDDNYFRDFARKTLERMRPEQATLALTKPFYLGGFYTAPDASCGCPFAAGLGLDPKAMNQEWQDKVDFAMYMAATEAGFLDVTDEMKNPYFAKGLGQMTEIEVRTALEVARTRT